MYFNKLNKNYLKVILLLFHAYFLGACSNYSHKLTSYNTAPVTIEYDVEDVVNEVSVIFVIDGSGSMYQEKKVLGKNIEHLSALFKKKRYFNYNFAMTMMADYNIHPRAPLFYIHPDFGSVAETNSLCHSPNIDSKTVRQFVEESAIGPFFRFTPFHIKTFSDHELFCFLAKTIEKGTPSGLTLDEEYYFLPIFHAMRRLTLPHVSLLDKGQKRFFSEDSFLIIIFISDARGDGYVDKFSGKSNTGSVKKKLPDDFFESVVSTEYSEDFYQQIKKYKKSDRIRVYGVLQTNSNDCEGISAYEGGPPYHALALIKKTEGTAFPLCNTDWGSHIKVIVKDLDHFLPTNRFFLDAVPDLDSLEIFHNDIKVERGINTWYYDPSSLAVVLDLGSIIGDELMNNDHRILIQYNPINPEVLLQE